MWRWKVYFLRFSQSNWFCLIDNRLFHEWWQIFNCFLFACFFQNESGCCYIKWFREVEFYKNDLANDFEEGQDFANAWVALVSSADGILDALKSKQWSVIEVWIRVAIFLFCTTYQNGKKYIYQITTKDTKWLYDMPNVHKCTKVQINIPFLLKKGIPIFSIQRCNKCCNKLILGFLVCKYTI
jgi:hypothetical protein